MVNLVVEHNQRSTWRRPLREPRDAPLGGHCGETTGLEGTPSTFHHTSRDLQTEFVRESGSSLRSVVRRWEDMILPGREDQRNCVDLRNLGKSKWDQKLGNTVYFRCMTRWDENEMMSIYSGVSRIYTPHCLFHLNYPSISVHPPSLLNDILGGLDYASSEMHLEARIEWTARYTPRLWVSEFVDAIGDGDWVKSEIHLEAPSSEFEDAIGDQHWVNSEMHLEAMIEWGWGCTWRTRLSELRDALGGRDWSSLEIHWKAVIERVWTCTWRLRLSELRDALQGYHQSRSEEYLKAVDLEGGPTVAETLFIG